MSRVLVRRACNTMLPVHRLPPEILTRIFYYAPESSIPRDKVIWIPTIFRMKDVIVLAAVCRHWRDVVIGAAILWSSVNRPVASGGHMKRSSGVGLNCQLSKELGDNNMLRLTEFLTNNGRRIRELHVMGPDRSPPLSFPLHEAQFDAKKLEVVSLIGSSTTPGLFEAPVLNLHRLVISNSESKLPTGQLAQLTQLCLSKIETIHITEVLELLSRAPSLQDVHLVDSLRKDEEDGLYRENIPLRNLRRLSIRENDPVPIFSLLSYLLLEPSTALRIRYGYSRACQLSTSKLPSSLFPISEPILRISIIRRGISLKFIGASPTSGIRLEWLITYREDAHLPSSIYAQLFPGANPHQVSLIWADSYSKSLPSGLVRALPESVTTLVTSTAYLEFLMSEFEVEDPTGHVPCHNLSTIHVLIDRQRSRVDLALSKICPFMTTIAGQRAKLGCPLERIVLTSFNNEDGEKLKLAGINALKRAVKIVEHEAYSELPIMEMPPICTAGDGTWWPSWTDQWRDAGPDVLADWAHSDFSLYSDEESNPDSD
ncbi:hypothetical protein OBBRIDRAFT_806854 [Obba rivulosa]|uniref:F-box domain-containing protein n=1 Tax=Obba rivulosa TaxID=1052685 RepID=A0A8E2AKT3_9APHY|nr:hypothetical protein OBBRIDRAFT_806854 [Obba rivulosa]